MGTLEYSDLSDKAKTRAIRWYRENIEYFGKDCEWALSNKGVDEILDNMCEYHFTETGKVIVPIIE